MMPRFIPFSVILVPFVVTHSLLHRLDIPEDLPKWLGSSPGASGLFPWGLFELSKVFRF